MSYNLESQTIQLYSYLFDHAIAKDDKYWKLFFEYPFHYVSLNSKFEHLNIRQVQDNSLVLNTLFKQALTRLDDSNSLNILRILIKNICMKEYGGGKNEVMLKIFGNINELNDNFVKLLTLLKQNLNQIDNEILKFASFKLFATCCRSFYSTIVFEIFYQIELNDEIYSLFLIENLEYELIGEIFVTLAILNNNSLVSSNFYKLRVETLFEKQQILSNLNFQLKQFFILGTLFYHDLKPDLLVKKEQNSSFFNWITFNKYNVKLNDFKSLLLKNLKDEDLKFFLDVKIDKFNKRKELLKEMIPVYLFFYSILINNDEYGELICSKNDEEEIQILEIFLSLSSFIFQHQHTYNQFVCRLNLMILNKLVSSNLDQLLMYYLDQYKVKLCYQRQPIINPIGEIEYLPETEEDDDEEKEWIKNKNSLYYILDVIQCQLRYNLSKKLDLISYKLSNLIILQVISALNYDEKYNWHDFCKTLFQVLKFFIKNFSKDIKIASLIEELLIIIEILLVNFKTTDELVEIMYKILENNEFLLILKNFNNGNLPNLTIVLNLLVTKFATKISDSHYSDIYLELSKFIETDEEFNISDEDLYEKIIKHDVIFENEETFKYLKMNNIYNNNKISLVNKSIEEIVNDYKLFY